VDDSRPPAAGRSQQDRGQVDRQEAKDCGLIRAADNVIKILIVLSSAGFEVFRFA
jgi:hypothetical protein